MTPSLLATVTSRLLRWDTPVGMGIVRDSEIVADPERSLVLLVRRRLVDKVADPCFLLSRLNKVSYGLYLFCLPKQARQ